MKSIIEIITVIVFLGCIAMLAGMQQSSCDNMNDVNFYPAVNYADSIPPPPPVLPDTISMAIHNH